MKSPITHLQQPLDQLMCLLDIPQCTISLLHDPTVVRIRRVPCSREPFLQLRVLALEPADLECPLEILRLEFLDLCM